MRRKITMQDVADMCGVTKSTVSRYFNGGSMKEETRKKIKAIIDQYHYEPNTFAQSLKARKSKIIGIIAPCLDSTVSSRILMSIDEYLRKHNYTSLIINTNHDDTLELKSMESLWRMNVDGMILLATSVSEAHKAFLNKIDIPFVFVGQQYEEGISIINNDYEAGKMIGKYVRQQGFQDVVYVSVDEEDVAVGVNRKQGVLDGLSSDKKHHVKVLTADFSYSKTEVCMKQLLQEYHPEIIICATDKQALATYKAVQDSGLHIPNDISIIGFGGYEVCSLIQPRLTTVKFDNEKAGFLAAKTILDLINKHTVDKVQIISYEFMEGDSVRKRGK